ncbi:MAG TPA: hypothetical protein VLE95_05765 [Chlamydiales bacterium]|nr:hypothetical protein [Chlamydiales bacterium]
MNNWINRSQDHRCPMCRASLQLQEPLAWNLEVGEQGPLLPPVEQPIPPEWNFEADEEVPELNPGEQAPIPPAAEQPILPEWNFEAGEEAPELNPGEEAPLLPVAAEPDPVPRAPELDLSPGGLADRLCDYLVHCLVERGVSPGIAVCASVMFSLSFLIIYGAVIWALTIAIGLPLLIIARTLQLVLSTVSALIIIIAHVFRSRAPEAVYQAFAFAVGENR